MKGLRKYIAKHGRHLTEQLAMDVLECRWNIPEVVKATESKVYYNVSEATLGDIVLMVNHFNSCFIDANKYDCVKWALSKVGDVNTNGYAFEILIESYNNIDLRKYITTVQ